MRLREFKASPLAKRRTAKPATKAGHCLCLSQHGGSRRRIAVELCLLLFGKASRHNSTSHGSFHFRLIGDAHASVRASDVEKERSGPTADATSPLLVGCDRSI